MKKTGKSFNHQPTIPSAIALVRHAARTARDRIADAVRPCLETLEARQLLNGALDTTFGVAGKAITDFGAQDSGDGLVMLADGKFIVVGESNGEFAVAKYNANGSLDTSFGGGDGKVTTAIGTNAHATSVVVDGSGRIVVGGYALVGSTFDFALARYDSGGNLDSSFGTGGIVTTDFATRNDRVFALTIQPTGEILAIGTVFTGPAAVNQDFGLARYNALDGSLDTTFDTDGKVTTDLGGADQAYAVAYDTSLGRILVAGTSGGDMALARYTLSGALDSGFDGDGRLLTVFPGSAAALAVGIDSSGRYVAAGVSGSDFAVARYSSTGAPDATFDGDGRTTFDFSGGFDQANGLAFQADGKIIVAGVASDGGSGDFGLARLTTVGALDTTFGLGTGKVTTDIQGNSDSGAAVAIQPTTNKIVVAGTSNGGVTQDNFAATRYDTIQSEAWVNDNWVITNDVSPAGLSFGDTVQNTGAGDSGALVTKVYGFDAFNSIEDALVSVVAGPGAIVHVEAGTYLTSDISVDKQVSIDGYAATRDEVVIAPDVADGHLLGGGQVFNPLSHNAFVIRSSNVTIRDLTIDGDAGFGGIGSRNYFGGIVYDYNLGQAFNNLTASNLVVTNLWRVGIYFDGGINAESTGHVVSGNEISDIDGGAGAAGILMLQASGSVVNNTISGVDGDGIASNYIDGAAYAPNLVIQGNDIEDVDTGMNLSGMDTGSLIGGTGAGEPNTIDLTVGAGLNDVGIVVQYSVGPITVRNNVITASDGDSGIWLYKNSAVNAPTIRGNTITASASDGTNASEGTGIFVTDDGSFFSESSGVDSYAVVNNNTVSGFARGIDLYRNEDSPVGGGTVQVTITNNNNLSANATGIRVFDANGTTAADALAIITSNSASIHGSAVGIDVDGGTATITGNHIYDNTIGVQVRNGGTASLDDNDFDGPADDNDTDLKLLSTAGSATVGATTPNDFAGDTFFIDNLSTQNLDASNNNFDEASNFRIEDKMHHRVDTDLPVGNGLISWVASNIYITDPAGIGTTDSSIQRGVDAASAGNIVNVEDGVYDQVTDVNKGVTLLGHSLPTITRTAGSDQSLMSVTADNVTIEGFDFDVARPFATAGIAALNPATFDNLLIKDNNFDISGSGGTFPNPFITTSSVAIALLGNGTPFENVTVSGNTINNNGSTLFARGIWLREVRATIGGATPADGNSIIASTQDVLMQFASGGTSTVRNNTMLGAGIDVTEPNSSAPVNITDNDFLPVSPLFPQSVLVKNADSSAVTVSNNTFVGHTVGVLAAGSTGTVVSDNDFTPASGATAFTHVRVDTRVPTGGPQPAPFLPNSITITGNDFNESTVAGGVGVELLNGNPGAAVPDFGAVTVGGAGALANKFQNGLTSYIRLDQGATPPYAPVTKDVDGTQNLYEVTGGTLLPGAMSLAQRFELEDKIVHEVDVASLGFVTVVPGRVFVTPNSFEAPATTAPSIQRGVDASSNGDTVHVAAGTYTESVNVNKSITLSGAQAGVDARGRAASESIITPSVADETLAVVNVTAANVVIDGFSIDGDGPVAGGVLLLDGLTSSNAARGIVVDADNVQALNNIVSNTYRRGVQFWVNASSAPLGGLIHQNEFNVIGAQVVTSANSGDAILAFNDASATDNDVNTATTGITFIQVYAPNVTPIVISGNDIDAINGIALNETSSGIPNITITANTVTSCDNGIGLQLWTVDGTATISGNTFTGSGVGDRGIYAWDGTANDAMNVTITGGSFAGYQTGAYLTNEEQDGPFGNALNNATLTLDGVTISATTTGVHVLDTAAGTADVHVNVTNDTDISTGGAGTGIRVEGDAASATITNNDNSINNNATGVNVSAGTALLANNDLNGNTIGVLIQNGAVVDLGQNGPGTNFTGLGISTGGNDFTGYTTTATTSAGAIVNLNNNPPNNLPGRQGLPSDVPAFNNLWAVSTSAGIENVIYHDVDDTTRGFVDYAVFGNLLVSVTDTSVDEGSTTTVNGSFSNVATAHTVTINWGDGSPSTVLNLLAGVENFSIPSPAGTTYGDDPDGPVNSINYGITVTVEENLSLSTVSDNSLGVTVSNVAPTIAVTGIATVNEGSSYTLNLGAITDPGIDTVYRYIISWGDGNFADILGDPTGTVHNHTYDDGTIARNITISLFDEDASPHSNTGNPNPFSITVQNVAPVATFFNGGSVPEGTNGFVGFAAQLDPSTADTTAGFRYSYDFNNDGDFTDTGEFTDVVNASVGVPAIYLADGPGSRTVRARIKDKDGGFTDYTTTLSIFNLTPSVNGGPNINVPATVAFTQNGNFIDPGADSPWVGKVDYEWHPGDVITDGDVQNLPLAGFNFTLGHTYNTPGTYTIRVYVTDKDGATGFDDVVVNVGPVPSFQVQQFTTNASGFTVRFNRSPNLSVLNLYDGLAGVTPSSDIADITLVGNTVGAVRGSLVWTAATNALTFVRTGGPLVADTYSVTVRSASDALKDTFGALLDGNADNTPGDNYTQSFAVAATPSRVLSLPDFTRGPDSASNVNVPNTGSLGLPVRIDDGTQVRSVDFTLTWDPTLLNVTAAQLAAGLPGDWAITANLTTPGTAIITVFGTSADLPAGPQNLVKLIANVPNSAPYTAAHALRLSSITVQRNDSSLITTRGDSAVHKVAYLGDADGNRAYTGSDAALISRVVVSLDTGFHAMRLVDPIIIADSAAPDGALSGLDASYVAQKAALLPRPEIPDLPGVLPPLVGGGVDPIISGALNVPGKPGGTANVAINIDDALNTYGFNVVIENIDASELTVADDVFGVSPDVTLGSLYAGAGGWTLTTNVDAANERIIMVFFRSTGVPMPAGGGAIANVNFTLSNALVHNQNVPVEVTGPTSDQGLTFSHSDGSILVDAVAPVVTDDDFVYQTSPHKIVFDFNEDVSASLSVADLTVFNVSTSTTIPNANFVLSSYDSINFIATFSYTGGTYLPDGDYTATLAAAGVTDAAGNPLAANYVANFFFLQGDADHDRDVDLDDFNILAINFGQSPRDFTQADFTYNTVVDLDDFNLLAINFGASLSPQGVLSPPTGGLEAPAEWLASATEAPAPLGRIGGSLAIPTGSRTPTSARASMWSTVPVGSSNADDPLDEALSAETLLFGTTRIG